MKKAEENSRQGRRKDPLRSDLFIRPLPLEPRSFSQTVKQVDGQYQLVEALYELSRIKLRSARKTNFDFLQVRDLRFAFRQLSHESAILADLVEQLEIG
ncbi:MAG: hypothetical protein ACOC0U_07210 [Desulfovibrionales bacterium]